MSIFKKLFVKKKQIKKEKKPIKKEESPKKKVSLSVKSKEEKIPSKKPALRKKDESYRVLIEPVITERAMDLRVYNQYVFKVTNKANKSEIKKAVESKYGIKPIKVNIINVFGKQVRYGRTQGRTKNWKKAIITLKQGDKIEI